ncbi:MAG TPA: hypothetical protein DCE14_04855 [Kosmotogaceae bacterium]|nr:MAG: Uncharacterized protein XE05_0552 [Thermotogales bacterium 46_20]HAA85668.1 hypothetical protein [Kosmotogaceae bacterium]
MILIIISLGVLFVASSILAIKSSSSFNAVIWFGILGFLASAMMFLAGAPDVALTQVTIGVVLVVLVYIMAIRKQRKVRLGYISKPQMIEEGEGGLAGLEWDLISKIDEKEGYDVDAVNYDNLRDAISALISGRIDVICGGITRDSLESDDGIVVVPYLTVNRYAYENELLDFIEMKELMRKNPTIRAIPVKETEFVFLLSETSKDISAFFEKDLGILVDSGELERLVSKHL